MRSRRVHVLAVFVLALSSLACSDYTGLTPTVESHLLKVQGSGGGSGLVTSPGASPEISCTISSGALSGQCANGYPGNSAVALVATPAGGSAFLGWTGACVGTDGCVVDMSQERTVTASFARAAASH